MATNLKWYEKVILILVFVGSATISIMTVYALYLGIIALSKYIGV